MCSIWIPEEPKDQALMCIIPPPKEKDLLQRQNVKKMVLTSQGL